MNTTTSTLGIIGKLNEFATRGFRVSVTPARSLRVQPARLLTDGDRSWFRVHSGAVVSYLDSAEKDVIPIRLAGSEPWDKGTADRLTYNADSLVERLGTCGFHPEIASTAAMVCSAHDTKDMETLRFACSEFCLLIRQLAGQQDRTEQKKIEPPDHNLGESA